MISVRYILNAAKSVSDSAAPLDTVLKSSAAVHQNMLFGV